MRASLVWPLLLLAGACAQEIVVDARDAAPGDRTDGGAAVADSGSTGGGDAGAADAAPADAGGADAGGADAEAPDSGALACLADPFDPCDDPAEVDDTDNEWIDARYVNRQTVGCLNGDEFTPLDVTIDGKVCPNDPADWYQQLMVCCDTRTMIAEIRLKATTQCDPQAFALRLSDRMCTGDPNTRCSEENGEQVIEALIPPCGVVFGWHFAVEKLRQDVELDYQLRFILR